ncbi:hypothetical protein GFB49_17535 [Epibacterium sp. SM1979]|uniref:Uncharacterized protein n=1 Tax=Tritonibacter litoralis TaxID=2662264 RepID=A0A843YM49_9RHOB|nr:hypothetical protein [Tritonibacter litoralis]MQQ10273.1 hypothetical protein [Tritonibacter litoralis]
METGFKQLSTADRIQVQRELAAYNFYGSTLDGLWGRNTAHALRQALGLMEHNMGHQIDLSSSSEVQIFLGRFIDGSASAFIWGEGEECDGCGEDNVAAVPEPDQYDSADQTLEQAIYRTCLRNAKLINQFISTDPLGSDAFNTKGNMPSLWSQIGIPASQLKLRHVNNQWQPVGTVTLEALCKDQEAWAEPFGSELQYRGERQRFRDLAYFNTETQQPDKNIAVYGKHTVAVYPLSPKEIDRLNGISNALDFTAVSFHLTEQTACREPQGTAVRSQKPISECGGIHEVMNLGKPVDLTQQSRCRVTFHVAANTFNVEQHRLENSNLTAFNKTGGYAALSQPFAMTYLSLWSQADNQDWHAQGSWFLESPQNRTALTDILSAATDAFEQSIDWQGAQQELNKSALHMEALPANGRDTSPVVTHPACQAALTDTRNQVASER